MNSLNKQMEYNLNSYYPNRYKENKLYHFIYKEHNSQCKQKPYSYHNEDRAYYRENKMFH